MCPRRPKAGGSSLPLYLLFLLFFCLSRSSKSVLITNPGFCSLLPEAWTHCLSFKIISLHVLSSLPLPRLGCVPCLKTMSYPPLALSWLG